MGRCLEICKLVTASTAVILIGLGAGLKWGIFPAVVDSMVKSQLELNKKNTETWEAWIEPPITPFMKFTFFNVTNLEDIRAGKAKPSVSEEGPFVYREIMRKENLLTIEDEIRYGSYKHNEFDETESCETCKIDTKVTVINPVIVLVSYLIENIHTMTWPDISLPIPNVGELQLSDLIDTILGMALNVLNIYVTCGDEYFQNEGMCDDLFLTETPDNMIFQGIHSGILKSLWYFLTDVDSEFKAYNVPNTIVKYLNILFPGNPNLENVTPEEILNLILTLLDAANLPPMIDLQNGTFGFFKGTNATKSWWKINSGKYNMDNYNKILEYNGMTKLPDSWWENFGPTPSAHESGVSGICHDIIGTDGVSNPPFIDKDTDMWLFNDQLCRSIWLSYEEEVSVGGIKTYKYSPKPQVFSMKNPNNYCYCPNVEKCAVKADNDTWDISGCDRCIDGLLSLQGCQGAPVIISTPHFLDGDESLHQAIDGINPVKEDHVTFLNLEPMTGVPLQAHKRIQMNVPLIQSTYFDALKTVQDVVFPLVWVDEGADIDDENLKKAKGMLVAPFLAVDIGSGVMIAVGGLLIAGLILHKIFGKK